ncbi:MAG: C2 family cysteine protease [archaeon]|nr:C2 family cysteine protease [archaeon]
MSKQNQTTFNPMEITKYFKDQQPPNFDEFTPGENFKDPYFLPCENSLIGKDSYGNYIDEEQGEYNETELNKAYPVKDHLWKRVKDIREGEWSIFEDKIEFSDIKQGSVSDCYFLSAISALTEYPQLILDKFRVRKINEIGYYEVVLFIDGEWQVVILDDYFPIKNKDFIFAKPNGNELWVVLLEKAWAKVNGGYSNISYGLLSEALLVLTGFGSEFIETEPDKPLEIFRKIQEANEKGAVMGCGSLSSDTGKDDAMTSNNIVLSHAYTLIDARAKEDEDIFLYKIRNPWGDTEWTGNWSDKSRQWNDELKTYFGMVEGNDGTFFMDVDDFVENYEDTHICRINYGAKVRTFFIENEDMLNVPIMFKLSVFNKGEVTFCVTARDRRFNRSVPEDEFRPFSFMMFKYDENYNVQQFYGGKGGYLNISKTEDLEPGDYIILLYIPYDKMEKIGKNFKYFFSVSSKTEMNVKYEGKDPEFEMMEYMIISYYKNLKETEIKACSQFITQFFSEINKVTNICPLIVYNNMYDTMSFTFDCKNTKGYYILNRFPGEKEITVNVGVKKFAVIFFGLITEDKAKLGYGMSAKYMDPDDEETEYDYDPSIILKNKPEQEEEEEGIKSTHFNLPSKEAAEAIPDLKMHENPPEEQQQSEMNKINEYDVLKADYPTEFEVLETQFKPSEDPEIANLPWGKIQCNESETYIGQIKGKKPEGRGIYNYSDGNIYIGDWKDGSMEGMGILYNKKGKKQYKGTFKNNLISGTGIFYIDEKNNTYYIGDFDKNTMNGYGVLYEEGDKWCGTFKDGQRNGLGYHTPLKGRKMISYYKENEPQNQVVLKPREVKQLNIAQENMLNKQDQYVIGECSLKDVDEAQETFNNILTNLYQKKTDEEEMRKEKEQEKKKKEGMKLRSGRRRNNPNKEVKPEDVIENKEITGSIEQKSELPARRTERGEKKRQLLTQKKALFMKTQLFNMFPEMNEDTFKYEEEGVERSYSNITGNNAGLGALFDGKYYYIGEFLGKVPYGRIRKFDKREKFVMEGIMNVKEGQKTPPKFEDGEAKILMNNGELYEGEIKGERMNGKGKYTMKNGDVWYGNFVNDTLKGKGTYVTKMGQCHFAVEYNDSKIINQEQLPDENRLIKSEEVYCDQLSKEINDYLLQFLNRIPAIITEDTIMMGKSETEELFYHGQMCADQTGNLMPHGRGIQFNTGTDGKCIYIGNFYRGIKEGKGFMLDGEMDLIYQGDFKNDKYDGEGCTETPSFIFKGQFREGVPHGIGIKYTEDKNSKLVGAYENGKEVRSLTMNFEKGTFQENLYKNGNLVSQKEEVDTNNEDYVRRLKEKLKLKSKKYEKYWKLWQTLPKLYENFNFTPVQMGCPEGIYFGEVNEFGLKHGRGLILENPEDQYFLGYFEVGKKIGHGRIFDSNDKPIYEGEYVNGNVFGPGTFYNSEGQIMKADFNELGNGVATLQDPQTGRSEKINVIGYEQEEEEES